MSLEHASGFKLLSNYLQHYFGVILHKIYVMYYLIFFCCKLMWRGTVHDLSKFSISESKWFGRVIHHLSGSHYGSDDYKETLNSIKPAIEHHYQNNRHHPEYWKFKGIALDNAVDMMNLIDIVEMLADWQAAVKRHKTGNIIKSIDINKSRFNLSDKLCYIFYNTVK